MKVDYSYKPREGEKNSSSSSSSSSLPSSCEVHFSIYPLCVSSFRFRFMSFLTFSFFFFQREIIKRIERRCNRGRHGMCFCLLLILGKEFSWFLKRTDVKLYISICMMCSFGRGNCDETIWLFFFLFRVIRLLLLDFFF